MNVVGRPTIAPPSPHIRPTGHRAAETSTAASLMEAQVVTETPADLSPRSKAAKAKRDSKKEVAKRDPEKARRKRADQEAARRLRRKLEKAAQANTATPSAALAQVTPKTAVGAAAVPLPSPGDNVAGDVAAAFVMAGLAAASPVAASPVAASPAAGPPAAVPPSTTSADAACPAAQVSGSDGKPPPPWLGDAALHLALPYGMIPPPLLNEAPAPPPCAPPPHGMDPRPPVPRGVPAPPAPIKPPTFCSDNSFDADYRDNDDSARCEEVFSDLAAALNTEDPETQLQGFRDAQETFKKVMKQARHDAVADIKRAEFYFKRKWAEEKFMMKFKLESEIANHLSGEWNAALDSARTRVVAERDNPKSVALFSRIGEPGAIAVLKHYLVCSGKQFCSCRGCHALAALESVKMHGVAAQLRLALRKLSQ